MPRSHLPHGAAVRRQIALQAFDAPSATALAQSDIEHHHGEKAQHDASGSPVGMRAQVRLRNELLNHDEHHRAGRKGEHPGHIRRYEAHAKHNKTAKHRFGQSRKGSHGKCLRPAHTLLNKWQRHRRTFGNVLYANAEGEGCRHAHQRRISTGLRRHGEKQTDAHAFGYVMKRHRSEEQRRTPPTRR